MIPMHLPLAKQMRPEHRLANDEPFGEVDASKHAELRVPAFDERHEAR